MPLDAGVVLRRLQFAEPVKRRAVPQCIVGHLLQESRIGLRAGGDLRAQCVGEPRRPPQRAKVEEYARRQQTVRIAAVDPVRECRLPFGQARAPARVGRHDASLAQRVAAAVHRIVDGAREREEAFADRVRRGVGVGREDEAVVLVRGDRLFGPAFRTHSEPAERNAREIEFRRHELENAHGELVVEARDHPCQMTRGHALRDQRMRQRADVRRALNQRLDVGGAVHRRGELPHRKSLQAEEIAFGDDPGDLAAGILHDDVAYSAACHHHRRIAGGRVRGQRDRRCTHHVAHRNGRAAAAAARCGRSRPAA